MVQGQGLFVRYNSTAHILGAMFITISWLKPNGEVANIVMSGDLGNNTKENPYQPLLNHRKSIQGYPDAIVVESTYGDKLRDSKFASHDNRISELKSIIQKVVFDEKSLLVIPTFSLQRSQEVLLDLYCIFQKYFRDESDCLSPLFINNPNNEIFKNNCWNLETNNMLKSALGSVNNQNILEWESAIIEVDKNLFTFTEDASFTIKDIENLLFKTKQPYPVSIVLDSKLSREMSPIFRSELVRRNADNPNTLYWRNPLMMQRLELESEEQVDDVINKLYPPETEKSSYGFPMGMHYIKYRDNFDLPKHSSLNKQGQILITGGGMCNGGPILEHLVTLSNSTIPSVILLNGYMTKGSIGNKLLQISNAQAENSSIPFEFLEIGDNKIPVNNFSPRIIQLQGYYSGHADQKGILDFIFNISDVNKQEQVNKKTTVFINHGVNSTRKVLKKVIEETNCQQVDGCRQVANVELPTDSNNWYDLNEMQWIVLENESQTDKYLRQILDEQRQTNALLQMIVTIQKKQDVKSYANFNSDNKEKNQKKRNK